MKEQGHTGMYVSIASRTEAPHVRKRLVPMMFNTPFKNFVRGDEFWRNLPAKLVELDAGEFY